MEFFYKKITKIIFSFLVHFHTRLYEINYNDEGRNKTNSKYFI